MTTSSLTSALRIGTAGMQLSQVGLGTISHNVVNTNTAGFSRQVVQTSSVSIDGFGYGVQLSTIQRITDRFLNIRNLNANSDLANSTARRGYLDAIEGALTNAGTEGGVASVVGNFLDAVNQLSVDSANSSLRRNVVQQAELVTQTLRTANSSVQTVATDADNEITAELNKVNSLLKEIYTLNVQIAAQNLGQANGANSNDLRDTRDIKVAELSKSFKVQVTENTSSGGLRLVTENGRRLADEGSYVQFKRGTSGVGFTSIVSQSVQVDGNLSPTTIVLDTNTLSTGKIKALVQVRDIDAQQVVAQLDEFALVLKDSVNKITSRASSYPPLRTLTSANTGDLIGVGSNMYADPKLVNLANSSFNVSVVNSLGDVITTTVGGTPISLPNTPGPFSLNDLSTLINNNVSIGNTALGGSLGVTATASVNTNGDPIITISSTNPNNRIVLSNINGDFLGIMGLNNLFTGTSSNNIAVESAIANNPDLIPVGLMRTDGGLSSTDNRGVVALAQLTDNKQTFAAAGGLGTQTDTLVGYAGEIVSNFAVSLANAKDREKFNDNLKNQIEELATSVSGVNLNEELSLMLIYQNSFQASARIITVVSDMMDVLMNTVR